MERLSAALARWRPPAGASLDHAVAGNWERIVGHGVAANARPCEVRDGTLTVLVPSSAWRHELAFHAPSIIAALQALPEIGAELQRLRIRLGRAQAPARTRSGRPGGSRTRPPQQGHGRAEADQPAPDAASAFARLRASFARIAQEEREHGREPCPACGAFVAPGGTCAGCERRRLEEIERTTQRHLFDSPWIGYEGVAALVPGLDFRIYARVRARTLERWWRMLQRMRYHATASRDGRERKVAQSYVTLKSGLPPERLTPLIVRDMLGDQIYNLLWGVHDAR